jgi:hypothetical protein
MSHDTSWWHRFRGWMRRPTEDEANVDTNTIAVRPNLASVHGGASPGRTSLRTVDGSRMGDAGSTFRVHYGFDFGAACLWSGNDPVRAPYGYPIHPAEPSDFPGHARRELAPVRLGPSLTGSGLPTWPSLVAIREARTIQRRVPGVVGDNPSGTWPRPTPDQQQRLRHALGKARFDAA